MWCNFNFYPSAPKPLEHGLTLFVREDDFSIQFSNSTSKRFFIRVVDPGKTTSTLNISDFLISADEEEEAIEALALLHKRYPRCFQASSWLFSNLSPSHTGKLTKDEREKLVSDFDTITKVLKRYCSHADIEISNIYLKINRGTFEGIVEFRGEGP
ncbi:hypothetical protein ROA7450_03350 [Roseovarius albus]|uniref:Uncharacterized protein n=2 Tax=Roseovarius albus TaxID=1247867 RepID=A0A1X6ZWK9_9RHOB|nr:hypothetical protein ROA7450_03350 [Roseovarius albus]